MFLASRRISMRFFAAAACLLLLAACATPASRIKRNQALYDSLSPAEQALVREGKVAVGFTPEMVRLAVGEPDRRWTRTEAQGKSEVWSYQSYEGADGVPIYGEGYGRADGYPIFNDNYYRYRARPREYFKVTFIGGRVSAIEQETR